MTLPRDPPKIFKPRRTAADRTPAERVFKFRYRCKISKIHTLTEREIQRFGTISTGDKEMDRALASEMVVANYSPAEMAKFYNESVQFYLLTPRDAIKIYHDLTDHLNNWAKLIRDPLITLEAPPLEELQMLEALAGAMYHIARPYIIKDGTSTSLVDRLTRFGGSRWKHMNNRPEVAKVTEAAVVKVEHRMTITDSIASFLADRGE